MLRVSDPGSSLAFYCEGLGMKEYFRKDYEEGRFTLIYLGYDAPENGPTLELTHNWDQVETLIHGTAYGHIAVGVDDIYQVTDRLSQLGFEIARKPGPMAGGPVIAFAADPDGYKVELIDERSYASFVG